MNYRHDESAFCDQDDEEKHSSSPPPLHDNDPNNTTSLHTALTTTEAAKNTPTTTAPATTTMVTSTTCASTSTPPQSPPQSSPPQPENPPSFSQSHPTIATLHHLTAFSILGLSLRIFLGRLLGGDCHLPSSSSSPTDDWLTPLSTRTCVTSHDGALFVDLPANMLGSFFLGMATGPRRGGSSSLSPWDIGIRTGLCGNITTFSSWNSAMISLMVGMTTMTKERNVAAACFGYVLGTMGATESFRGGRTVAAWWGWCWRGETKVEEIEGLEKKEEGESFEDEGEEEEEKEIRPTMQPTGIGMSSAIHAFPTILSLVLLALYLIGDLHWNIPHYRPLWMASLLSPLGTYCRWNLSKFNHAPNPLRRCQRQHLLHHQPHTPPPQRWFPLGTFLANLSGSIVSAAIAALLTSPSFSSVTTAVLRALSLGFAGGLSTVSTFASEVVGLGERHPSHEWKAFGYWIVTVGVCCLLGLGVFGTLMQIV